MAKKKVVVSTTAKKKVAPTVSKARKSTASAAARRQSEPLVFSRSNYLIMLGGIGLILLGLLLMSGGAMPSPDVWDESIIYSARRTVIAPMVIILGLVVNIVAIFHQPKPQVTGQPDADL